MQKKKNYLGIMFECCQMYSRIYKNKNQTAYEGYCPQCRRFVSIKIGSGGTNNRFFRAKKS